MEMEDLEVEERWRIFHRVTTTRIGSCIKLDVLESIVLDANFRQMVHMAYNMHAIELLTSQSSISKCSKRFIM
jgi:hypothetical protein